MSKKINEATSTDLPIIAHVVASRALGFRGEAISDTARGLLRTKNTPALAGGARESVLAMTCQRQR